MTEYFIRFLLGGAAVSAFALIGDVLRPKSFAGLFGAAPSVALVSLALAISSHGPGVCIRPGRLYGCRSDRSLRLLSGDMSSAEANSVVCHLRDVARATRLAGCSVQPLRGDPVMLIRVSLSSLGEGRWYEHVIRFVLGGAATVVTGLIGAEWGPGVGGLFLAFPAMLCASASLVQSHERRRKKEAGLEGTKRGKDAAALDAAGAALGSMALATFALTILVTLASNPWGSLAMASLAWTVTGCCGWWAYKRCRKART